MPGFQFRGAKLPAPGNFVSLPEIASSGHDLSETTYITKSDLERARRAGFRINAVISAINSEVLRREGEARSDDLALTVDSESARSLLSLELVADEMEKILSGL